MELRMKNQYQIMNYEQIVKLFKLLNDELIISCEMECRRSLVLSLREIIVGMKETLEHENVPVKDIRLIGGAASHVIAFNYDFPYNDIDVVFSIDSCTSLDMMDKIRKSVFCAIGNLLFKKGTSDHMYPEKYIKKQVCVLSPKGEDYWSLFSLGCHANTNNNIVELKFASSSGRQYECSVDSFQIKLDPALHFINKRSNLITKSFYPTVVMESTWGSIKEALQHLYNRHIVLDSPDQIRGGGLLKFCKLLVNGFQPHPDLDENYVKKYMCSRFFIDFPFFTSQSDKIISYMENHFQPKAEIYIKFLEHLADIVTNSSVYLDVDRLRSVFLINSLIQNIWTESLPKIRFDQFDDCEKWSVGEIVYGSCDSRFDSISSSSSISTTSEQSPDQSMETDSLNDDSSVS